MTVRKPTPKPTVDDLIAEAETAAEVFTDTVSVCEFIEYQFDREKSITGLLKASIVKNGLPDDPGTPEPMLVLWVNYFQPATKQMAQRRMNFAWNGRDVEIPKTDVESFVDRCLKEFRRATGNR